MGTDYEDIKGLELVASKQGQVIVYNLTLVPDFDYVLVEDGASTLGNIPTGRAFSFTTRVN